MPRGGSAETSLGTVLRFLTLTCICKRQIARHLFSQCKIGRKGAREERSEGRNGKREAQTKLFELRERIHTDLPHHAAEILQRYLSESVQ